MKKFFLFVLFLVSILTGALSAQPKGGYALSFSGGDDVFNSNIANLATSTLTIEVWVYISGYGGTILSGMTTTPSDNTIALEVVSSTTLRLSAGRDGSRNMQNLTVSIPAGNWYHMAVTFNSGTASLYVNGVLKGSAIQGSTNINSQPFRFGSFHTFGSYNMNGKLDDIRIFTSIRTPAQIQADMVSDAAEGAYAFYNFNEGTGDVIADASGNGNTGFLGTSNGASDSNDPAWYTYATAPVAPEGVYSFAETGNIQVKWNKSGDPDVVKYVIYGGSAPEALQRLDSTLSRSDTTVTLSGLPNGEIRYFAVSAVSKYGLESVQSEIDFSVVAQNASRAVFFDGADDYINLGNGAELNITGDLTLEAWIFSTDFNQMGRIISKWGSFSGYELDVVSGTLRFAINQTVAAQTSILGYNGTWVHVAGVKSGTTASLYINGVLAATGSCSSSISNSSNDLLIGRIANMASVVFSGSIDEVRIWNTARSESEIFDSYYQPVRGDEPGLAGLWHLDEGSGTVTADASSNGNNGTLVNGPVQIISGAMGGGTVPVELSSFTGSVSGGKVVLNWSTRSETNNYGWEIQKSEDKSQKSEDRLNTDWESIGFIAGKGTTTEAQTYSFSSTFSSGKFRLKQFDTDGFVSYSQVLSFEQIPSVLTLNQNYPNPFNPSTVIGFALPVSGKVSLKIYDITGREIATLLNRDLESGSHSVTFDASGFAAGVYFCNLAFNGQVVTKKLTLLK
ncbi:MAG: T9SS type A sorting domain-containing protein [Bacteroidetes bacterium]|nr:T9SS type A sorting domain-containing protein [Bacteroidota bacterium]